MSVLLPSSGSRIRNSSSVLACWPSELLSIKMILPIFQSVPAVLQVGEAAVESVDWQIVTFAERLMASLRAKLMSEIRSLAWLVMRMFWIRVRMLGTAKVSSIAAMAIVTSSSTVVNPAARKDAFGRFRPTNGVFIDFVDLTKGCLQPTKDAVRMPVFDVFVAAFTWSLRSCISKIPVFQHYSSVPWYRV